MQQVAYVKRIAGIFLLVPGVFHGTCDYVHARLIVELQSRLLSISGQHHGLRFLFLSVLVMLFFAQLNQKNSMLVLLYFSSTWCLICIITPITIRLMLY